MRKTTVADLRAALADFRDDAIIGIMFESREGCALVAVLDEHVDALRGRMADDSCTVVIVEKIS